MSFDLCAKFTFLINQQFAMILGSFLRSFDENLYTSSLCRLNQVKSEEGEEEEEVILMPCCLVPSIICVSLISLPLGS